MFQPLIPTLSLWERTSSPQHRLVCNHCTSKLCFLQGQYHGSTQLNLLSPHFMLLGLFHVSQNHFLKNSDPACRLSSNAYQLRRHVVLAKHCFLLFVQSPLKPMVLQQNKSEHRKCPTSFLWSKNDAPARIWWHKKLLIGLGTIKCFSNAWHLLLTASCTTSDVACEKFARELQWTWRSLVPVVA